MGADDRLAARHSLATAPRTISSWRWSVASRPILGWCSTASWRARYPPKIFINGTTDDHHRVQLMGSLRVRRLRVARTDGPVRVRRGASHWVCDQTQGPALRRGEPAGRWSGGWNSQQGFYVYRNDRMLAAVGSALRCGGTSEARRIGVLTSPANWPPVGNRY